MLRSIQKLIGDKRKQLIFPIFLMSLDAIGSLVMYLMLYFTVIHLLNGSLTGGLVRNYTIVCLISIILRLIIYRSGYFLCFSRGAEMCSGLRLDLANHYRSLSLGYFNQNSSGYLLSTLTKDLSNFELVLTHTLPSIVKTLVMGCLILVGTFFINWKLALAECVVILIALPVLNWGNRLVEKYGTIKRDLTSKMISIVLEYIKGMKVFKSANMTSTHFTRMSDTLEDIRKTSVQAEVKTAAPTSMYLSHLPVEVLTEEQLSAYSLYMRTLGNRPDLFGQAQYPNASTIKQPTYYDVPPEALKDDRFAAMMEEATKYIGYPYVWGGSSPSTSFDCSGYISWVLNHSGWNVGRQTAQGLYNLCTPVSTAQVKPGDLVFFKGTYDTPGVSHCGIYVGNSIMLHCGDPISYTNLNSKYWQEHFYSYGRLP